MKACAILATYRQVSLGENRYSGLVLHAAERWAALWPFVPCICQAANDARFW